MRPAHSEWLTAHVAARTRFFDDEVLGAIGAGIGQIVVLGAGYDDRALRFRSPGVRFFEVDQPATQDDKRRRLERIGTDLSGLTLAAADFRVDRAGEVLGRHGHDSSRASLFICEGLLVYLEGDAVTALAAELRSVAGPGSRLAASLAVHPDGLESRVVRDRANARRPWAGAEPWRTILPVGAHLELLVRGGWMPLASFDDTAVHLQALAGRSLLVRFEPASLGPAPAPSAAP